MEEVPADSEICVCTVPIKMYSKVLQVELERFKADLPPDLRNDGA